MKKSLFLVVICSFLSNALRATTINWVGGTGNWDVATNWSPATIPTSTDDVLISLGHVTVPLNYAAVANIISVNLSGALTNDGLIVTKRISVSIGTVFTNNGSVSLLNSTFQTLYNNGNVDNYGTLSFNNISQTAIANDGFFVNRSGGSIQLTDVDGTALLNGYSSGSGITESAVFTNEANATLSIVACQNAIFNSENQPYSALNHEVHNYGTMSITTSGGVSLSAIFNAGELYNYSDGEIYVTNSPSRAITNEDLLSNAVDASIVVDNCDEEAIYSHGGTNDFANLVNSGYISINNTNNSNISTDGSFTLFDDFTNNATGEIIIANSFHNGYIRGERVGYTGTQNNYGILDIRGTYSGDGIKVAHSLVNHPCALIRLENSRLSISSGTLTNNGWIDMSYDNTISYAGQLVNNGVVGDVFGRLPTGASYLQNNRIMVQKSTGPTCVGQPLSNALTLGSLTGFTVNGFFTDAAATISAGTYNAANNTYTPNAAANGLTEVYVKVTDNTSGCTYVFVKLVTGGILFAVEYFLDADGDGIGGNTSVEACVQPPNYVTLDGDCDDNDPLEFPGQVWYLDADGDDYSGGANLVQCLRPAGAYFAASELLGTNNDCDDNDPLEFPGQTWYPDADGDQYPLFAPVTQCLRPAGPYFAPSELIPAIDCDDNDPLEHPGAIWYLDFDGDDYSGGFNVTQCNRPNGPFFAASELQGTNNDCDDSDPLEFPGAVWYLDFDGDDHSGGFSIAQCNRPNGPFFAASELQGTNNDCDDTDATVYAGAPELCDNQDNDCDNLVDEGVCGVSCADPQTINALPYTYSGTTQGFQNPYTSAHACSSAFMSGNDFVFKYVAPAPQVARIRLENTQVPAGTVYFSHAVFVLDGCPDAPGTQCLYSATLNSMSNAPLYIETAVLTAGTTYYIVVSSHGTFHQWFNFDLTIDLPTGNICQNAHPIASLPYVMSASTQFLGNDYSNGDACASTYMNGNDVVFAYTPTVTQVARLKLENVGVPAGTTFFGHALFVLDGCPDDPGANCLASRSISSLTNAPLYIETMVLTAGETYYVVLSSQPAFHQWYNYVLTIDLPQGNICQNAVEITSLPYTATGQTTCLFGNDYNSGMACNSSFMSGNDFVYKFTPAVSGTLNIGLSNLNDDYTGLFLLNGCPDVPGSTCAMATNTGMSNYALNNQMVAAGTTYYIVIASLDALTHCFSYQLDVSTIALPIELRSFSAQKSGQRQATVEWETANASGFSHFELERSWEGVDWAMLGKIDDKAFYPAHYAFVDQWTGMPHSVANVYYRLKMVDLDGHFQWSNIVSVPVGPQAAQWTLSPNPTTGTIAVTGVETPESLRITVADLTGRVCWVQNGTTTVNLTGWPQGVYIVELTDGQQSVVKRVVKE